MTDRDYDPLPSVLLPLANPTTPFERLGTELGKLVAEKNAAYGDSFARSGAVMAILYPNGITPAQMRDALGTVRVIDKLFRIANRKRAFGESPWRDIAGYGIVASIADEAESQSVDGRAE